MRHALKCHPSSFNGVWNGQQVYQIRKDDRGFKQGHSVQLNEWCPVKEAYTGRVVGAYIDYIHYGGEWSLPEGLCVFAIRVFSREILKELL